MKRFLLFLKCEERPGKTEKNHQYQYSRFPGSDRNLQRPKYIAKVLGHPSTQVEERYRGATEL
jgi:hypothetical protein